MQSADPTLKNNEIPKEFFCSLTQKLLLNPVTDNEGFNYEEIEIQKYLEFSNLNPMAKKNLDKSQLKRNISLQKTIKSQFVDEILRVDEKTKTSEFVIHWEFNHHLAKNASVLPDELSFNVKFLHFLVKNSFSK